MSKERKRTTKAVLQIRKNIKQVLDNKYFNLWMSKYESDLDPQVFHYLFKEFYNMGTAGGFVIKHTDELGIAPYTPKSYTMYGYPEKIKFTNIRNSPLVPKNIRIVNKDAVIGWCQSNHKSIKFIVDKYIDRILDVEMVINTQLETHKLPFLVGISPEDKQRAEDIVSKIMNNEPVVFMDLNDLNLVKTLVNGNPYIIDKLVAHKQTIEGELLTFLGLDNAVSQKVNLDITNANNSLINAFKDDIDYNIQNFVNDCAEYLGVHFYLTMRQPIIESVYEEGNEGLENNTTKTGVVGGGNNENKD